MSKNQFGANHPHRQRQIHFHFKTTINNDGQSTIEKGTVE